MQVLDAQTSLRQHLEKVKNKKITIVAAFGSGTEAFVDRLVKKNQVELIVGTINAFTSPDFIQHCAKSSGDQLIFFVDFGYQASIHWKLYLISPCEVIIGSANLTSTGLDLLRDTCVVIKSPEVYDCYVEKIEALKAGRLVVAPSDARFAGLLKKYVENHLTSQSGKARVISNADVGAWLDDETNQSLPLFIWSSRHDRATREIAAGMVEGFNKERVDEGPSIALRDFFTYVPDDDETLPYTEGDVVLCTDMTGGTAAFYTFDKIVPPVPGEDDRYFMFSFRKARYLRPFSLGKSSRAALRKLAPRWHKRNLVRVGRHELAELL